MCEPRTAFVDEDYQGAFLRVNKPDLGDKLVGKSTRLAASQLSTYQSINSFTKLKKPPYFE